MYFDDFKATQVHSTNVAGGDYYPFGLTMSDRELTAEPYRYGYQGQYSEENGQTGWNEFDARNYDARTSRWITADPAGQFSSGYIAMGNNPVTNVDPDGEWSSLASFGVGFVAGSVTSAMIAKANGANTKQAFLWGLAGGLAGGAIGVGLNNLGGLANFSFPEIDPKSIVPGVSTGFNTVTVLINNGAQKGVGGALGGHVSIGINGKSYGFSNADTPNTGQTNILGIDKDTWHAPGEFGEGHGLNSGDVRYDIPITDKQGLYIFDEINSLTLDPPNYGIIETRCTSAAARVLRAGKVIPRGSKLHQESPYQFRKYMEKKFKKYKVYGEGRKGWFKRKTKN